MQFYYNSVKICVVCRRWHYLVLHPLIFTKNLRCMDTPPNVSSIFGKGNNSCDVLLDSQDWKALPKQDLLLTLLHSEGPKLYTLNPIALRRTKTP